MNQPVTTAVPPTANTFTRLLGWARGRGSKAAADFTDVARGLATIEINTIVKRNMTGTRMPGVPAALVDIANAYIHELNSFRSLKNMGPVWAAGRPTSGDKWPDLQDQGATTLDLPDPVQFRLLFDRLGAISGKLYDLAVDGEIVLPGGDAEKYLLRRMERNSQAISAVLHRRADADAGYPLSDIATASDQFTASLTPSQLLVIRKIWEIGTEQIVAQTVVTLDGDLTSRLNLSMTGQDREAQLLMVLHQRSLEAAMGNWHALIGAAAQVVNGLVTGRPAAK